MFAKERILDIRNPTIVVITDRNDLDDQLYGTFCNADDLIPYPKQAESVEDLKYKLLIPARGIIFTTIQKFQSEKPDHVLNAALDKKVERAIYKNGKFPLLSDRRNIIVITDEAHRSQYDFIDGFARKLRDALPNASFIGFTGTPIELEDKSTKQVFGDYISVYDMRQSVEDKATVPIFYEGRLVKLQLINEQIDKDFEEITESQEAEVTDKLKTKWAAIEAMAGTEDRLKNIAEDIILHYEERNAVLEGKAMIVCMSRRICVDLYNQIIKLRPNWHDDDIKKGIIKVIMTGNVSKDPESFGPHIYSKWQRKEIERRMKDPDDPLKLVIVRDMWLTGFDVPPLHTMYIDKPMHGHTLMQAIARVNRVFKDKPAGLVVDYIGLADDLKKALSNYTYGGREAPLLPMGEAIRIMQEKHDVACSILHNLDFSSWDTAEPAEKLNMLQRAMDIVNADDDTKKRFLDTVLALSKAFSLVVPRGEAMEIRADVAFFQAVRNNTIKHTLVEGKTFEELDSAIKQIVSKGVASDKPIDIFDETGLKKPDLSILSKEFLDEISGIENKNLQIEVLRKLILDEIKAKGRKNKTRYGNFMKMLQEILEKYNRRGITSGTVIRELIRMAKEMQNMDKRAEELGLTEEEIAFYDIVSQGREAIIEDEEVKDIAREMVRIIKSKTDGAVDWTNRDNIKAAIRATVKRLLKRKGFRNQEELDNVVSLIIDQAVSLYEAA